MNKYIPAEKLIAEIERQQKRLILLSNTEQVSVRRDCALQNGAYSYILNIITSLQQEQPEIGLEKFTEKVKTFQARYKHSESISVKGAMAFMARIFYQYPNVARQWYDSLPKATMD